jgi:hypothetical protein
MASLIARGILTSRYGGGIVGIVEPLTEAKMLYLQPGEKITANRIASAFDERSAVDLGYLNGQLVFQVSVNGILVGYIMPPRDGGAWGINLSQGAHEQRGYYRPILRQANSPYGVAISHSQADMDDLVWDLQFFAPL